MTSQRVLCTTPGDTCAVFEVELPQELLSRSDVLRSAVSVADGGPPSLQLPAGATCSFFGPWKALVQAKASSIYDLLFFLSIQDALAGLQVCANDTACCCH